MVFDQDYSSKRLCQNRGGGGDVLCFKFEICGGGQARGERGLEPGSKDGENSVESGRRACGKRDSQDGGKLEKRENFCYFA